MTEEIRKGNFITVHIDMLVDEISVKDALELIDGVVIDADFQSIRVVRIWSDDKIQPEAA